MNPAVFDQVMDDKSQAEAHQQRGPGIAQREANAETRQEKPYDDHRPSPSHHKDQMPR